MSTLPRPTLLVCRLFLSLLRVRARACGRRVSARSTCGGTRGTHALSSQAPHNHALLSSLRCSSSALTPRRYARGRCRAVLTGSRAPTLLLAATRTTLGAEPGVHRRVRQPARERGAGDAVRHLHGFLRLRPSCCQRDWSQVVRGLAARGAHGPRTPPEGTRVHHRPPPPPASPPSAGP